MTTDPDPLVGQPAAAIPRRGARPEKRRRGVFDPNRVRFTSFVVIALALFGAAVLCVLAIWDYTAHGTAWRAIATLGVIAGTMPVRNRRLGKARRGIVMRQELGLIHSRLRKSLLQHLSYTLMIALSRIPQK